MYYLLTYIEYIIICTPIPSKIIIDVLKLKETVVFLFVAP